MRSIDDRTAKGDRGLVERRWGLALAIGSLAALACGPLSSSESSTASGDSAGDDLPAETCGNGWVDATEFCHVAVLEPLLPGEPVVGDFSGEGPTNPGSLVVLPSGDVRLSFGTLADTMLIDRRSIELASGLPGPKTALVAELDEEAGSDILVVDQQTGETGTYLNQGGAFGAGASSFLDGGPWNHIQPVDLDGDGLDDLVAEPSSQSQDIYLFKNTGGGAFVDVGDRAPKEPSGCFFSTSAQLPAFSAFSGGVILGTGVCNEPPASNPLTMMWSNPVEGPSAALGQEIEGEVSDLVVGEFDGDLDPEALAWDSIAHEFVQLDASFVGTFMPTDRKSYVDFCPECPSAEPPPTWLRLASGTFGGVAGDDITFQTDTARVWVFDPVLGEPRVFVTDLPRGPAKVADLNGDGLSDLVVRAATGDVRIIASDP